MTSEFNFSDPFSRAVFFKKYAGKFEDPTAFFKELASLLSLGDPTLEYSALRMFMLKRFSPGGRILAFAGVQDARVSLMNCTTHEVEQDTIESISATIQSVMRASSRGQGIGIDISKLRPKGAPVKNAAKTSTGSVSFMELIASAGKTIGQEGRRAALLFSIADDHPDLWRPFEEEAGTLPYDFLHIKRTPGRVENANISVRVSDALMQAVEGGADWRMSFTTHGEETWHAVKAADLFKKLSDSAWASAEPGILFWDTAKKMSNSDLFGYPIVGVNACSEQVLDQEGVCNLGSLNLGAYVNNPFTDQASFNFLDFSEDILSAVNLLDNVITLELERGYYISETQRRSLEELRRIGLGVMGLADALAMLGLKYSNNPKTVAFLIGVFSTLRDGSYSASAHLAELFGPAPVWLEKTKTERAEIVQFAFFETLPDTLKKRIVHSGTRNVTVLSIAPTGSISNLFGCSSGIEPVFALEYVRRVKMFGGEDQFVNYVHPSVQLSRSLGKADAVWDTAYSVSPEDHIFVCALAQKYIDQSTSKTVNFPSSATEGDVQEAYKLAYNLGLKGLSVYRDNSRAEQILMGKKEPPKDTEESCPLCGNGVIHSEGCKSCSSCEWSVCST